MRVRGIMTNTLCVLVYTPLIIMVAMLLAAAIKRDQKQSAVRQWIYFYAILLCWLVLEILYFVLPSPTGIEYVFDLRLPFVSLLCVSMFFIIANFYRFRRSLPKWLGPVLCIMPAITAVLAATTFLHPLLTQGFTVVSQSPLTVTSETMGPWYTVHAVHSEALVVTTAVLIFMRYKTLPNIYRGGSFLMIFSMCLFLILNVVETFDLDGNPLDFTLIGASIAGFLFYLATLVNGRMDFLHISRREVFNYLDEMVFILNADSRVLAANLPAQSWLASMDAKLEHIPFSSLLAQLSAQGKIKRVFSQGEQGEDIYVIGSKFPLIYHMYLKSIPGVKNRAGGVFAGLSDVTNNRLFMERLREMAGLDPLTGLPNRYEYQKLLRMLDVPESFPLSIIMGDVNGLKQTNDAYGHEEGDRLLKTVAAAMQRCSPENGYVARIGGDEFIMLVPHCLEEDAADIIRCIRDELAAASTLKSVPSVALGSATKRSLIDNINALISEADKNMYEDKK